MSYRNRRRRLKEHDAGRDRHAKGVAWQAKEKRRADDRSRHGVNRRRGQ